MSEKKKRYRATLESRHNDPKRVFSFQFSQTDERHKEARKWLEGVETDYASETGHSVSLAEIFTDMIMDYKYDRPKPMMTEKRMFDVVMKEMGLMRDMLRDIYERNPTIVHEAMSRKADMEEIDDDFVSGMFDDFINTGNKRRE